MLHKHVRFDTVLPVGGYVESGELPEETVVREAREETGLEIRIFDSKPEKIKTKVSRGINHGQGLIAIEPSDGVVQIDFAFFATTNDISVLGAGEISKESFYWMDKNEVLDSLIIPKDVQAFALRALQKLSS